MTRPAFDPERPIDRPVRRLVSIMGNGGGASQAQVWGLAQLRRFELATAEGMRPPTPFAAVVSAEALLSARPAIAALRASGCDEIHVQFDTLGGANEPRAQQLGQLVTTLQRHGMRVHGIFTLGQDHDDPTCFERLVAWVEDQRLAEVELRLWTPDPGGELIRELAREDRVRHRDLQRWDGAHVVVTPAQMSAETLYRGWVWARRQLGSLGSRWRRRPARLTALPGYLLEVGWAALAPLRARARARERLLPALGVGLVMQARL
ncbi:BchE/P-methylase family protein [Enhygromyxa salina]|uniref:BchE/P-methylase family protein n=1 Tax=Enhygromyxa salina TaxID=215803 RepID=A0A0C2D6J5_9BACT|nr:hypothetical protein [Enhygromyxa salina]KIG18786.1 BchE/P-methylase family protein [Enhygromyxa salina]